MSASTLSLVFPGFYFVLFWGYSLCVFRFISCSVLSDLSGGLRGLYEVLEIELRLTTLKASIYPLHNFFSPLTGSQPMALCLGAGLGEPSLALCTPPCSYSFVVTKDWEQQEVLQKTA